MKNLTCRSLDEEDFNAYDRLILERGSIFADRKWMSMLNGTTNILGLFDGSNNLLASCSIHESTRLGLKVVLPQSFCQASGPFFASQLLESKSGDASQRFFVSEISDFLSKKRYAVCSLNLEPGIRDVLPFRWKHFKVVPGFTYRIDLNQTEDQIFSGMTSTRRRNIRAALRDSIEVVALDSYEVVEQLAVNTFNRQGKRLPIERMRSILFEFANPQNSYAFAAFKNDEPIACVFCLTDCKTAYYLIGGYDEAKAHHGAGAACMQEAIYKAKSLGLKVFDFEGSVIPAIERYFRGFGGELTPYYTINRAWLPIEMLLKLRKRELF